MEGLTISPTGTISIPAWILQKYSFFVLVLLGTIALSALKVSFGRDFASFLKWVWYTVKSHLEKADRKRKLPDWIAVCETKEGWKQKTDAQFIDLEGRILKKLSFTVHPLGTPENWRAGFMLGNGKFRPQDIVDTKNAITLHVGSPPKIASGIHVWRYYAEHPEGDPEESPVLTPKEIHFTVEITPRKSIKVWIEKQIVYSSRIDFSFRQKVYLLAWADNFKNCRVKFKDIKFAI